MRILRFLAFSALAAAMLSGFSGAPAQVSVDIGVAPVCPYGYFDYAPYECAPYGYYGPDWFVGGRVYRGRPLVPRSSRVLWPCRQPLRSSSRLPRTISPTGDSRSTFQR